MTAPLYSGEWQLLSEDREAGTRKWIMALDEHNLVVKTESWVPSLLAETNAEDLQASEDKRFGDGQVVARIPMNILYGPLLEPVKQDDKRYLRKFLNDPDNRWMRSFRGRL